MPTTDWYYAGSVVNMGGFDTPWTDPAEAQGQPDVSYAYCPVPLSGDSRVLRATQYGIAGLPEHGAITNIEVVTRIKAQTADKIVDGYCKLVVGGVAAGDDKKQVPAWPTSPGDRSYSHAIDPEGWNVPTLTLAQVMAADFGFELVAHNNDTKNSVTAYVDAIKLRLTYDEPAAGYYGRAAPGLPGDPNSGPYLFGGREGRS